VLELTWRQVAETLRAMEEESSFVSGSAGLPAIRALCEACLRDLNSTGECVAPLDAGNSVFLKLQRRLEMAPAPPAHGVPVAVLPLGSLDASAWDLTVRRVAQGIDGVRCIRDIARQTHIDAQLVAQAVRTLSAFGCVAMAEPTLTCSRYACTALAAGLCWSELGRACCEALGVSPVALPRVALLYARLRPSESLAATLRACRFPVENPPFDVQRFICFGLLNGVIRRVQPYVYPVDGVSFSEMSIDEYLVREGLPLDDKNFTAALDKFAASDQFVVLWK
jgi:hypothetical protein